MNVICLEDEAFYALIEKVVERIKEKHSVKEDKWLTAEQAMDKLHIRSKTTLQELRDKGKIRYTQPQPRKILYDSDSIDEYLDKNAKKTF